MKKIGAMPMKRFILLTAVFSALLAALLAWCTPFSSDDYFFGSRSFESFSQLLYFLLHYDDGRLLGNGFNILLLHHEALRIAVKACMTAAMVVLPPLALGLKNKLSWFLSFLFVFGLSPAVFGQVYAMTSGIQNYVPPLLILIICYLLWQRAEKGSAPVYALRLAAVFILAAAGQLYMEHNAIISILASAAALVLSRKQGRRSCALAALWLLGCILGAAALFGIPKLFESLYGHGIGMYRQIHLSSLSDFFSSLWSNGLKSFDFIAENALPCAVLGITLFALLRSEKGLWKNEKLYNTAQVISLMLPVYVLLRRLFFAGNNRAWLWNLQQALFALLCVAVLAVMITAVVKLRDRLFARRCIIFIALASVALGVMLPVSPLAERCMYLTLSFLGWAVLMVADRLAEHAPKRIALPMATATLIAVLILSVCLGGEFLSVRHVSVQCEDYIAAHMETGDDTIKVCRVPSDYIYPSTPTWLEKYYYYEQEGDIQFRFYDYDSWSAIVEIEQKLQNE